MDSRNSADLQAAFVVDDFETMMDLIRHGVDPNSVDIRDGSSMLHRAIVQRRTDVVEFLIAQGADVNFREKTKGYAPLHVAAIYKDVAIAKMLVGANAQVDTKCKLGGTPLAYAITGTGPERLDLAKILVSHGANKSLIGAASAELNADVLSQV